MTLVASMSETMKLKDYFDEKLAAHLSDLIIPHFPKFQRDSFIREVAEHVQSLELKGRVAVIAEQLRTHLPDEYDEAVNMILNILGPENETETGMFTNGYFLMPAAYFVENYGVDYFDTSMKALYEITKRHTSEYAVRPFLARYPNDSIKLLQEWVYDDNLHVRRLVSEGTRPRLPWAKRIPVLLDDPMNNFLLLEPLLDDPSQYVRKSVANHLHDLAKDYKELTLRWLRDQSNGKGERYEWIVKHSLRTLIQSGDTEAVETLEWCKSG